MLQKGSMRRKLPSLLAILFILGLAGYLFSIGEKVIGTGLGLGWVPLVCAN
jgi:hypothetical protein